MKVFTKFQTIILGTIIVASFESHAVMGNFIESNGYLGFDVLQHSLKMVPGYGEGMFNKRVPEYNIVMGLGLHEYFGIEGGQIFSQNSTRTQMSLHGDNVFGVPYEDFNPDTGADLQTLLSKNTIKIYGTHINIYAQYPINHSKFHILGTIGFISLKVKAEHKYLAQDGILDPEVLNVSDRTFSTRRVIPRFGGGLQYQVTETLGLRFITNYETTAKFKNIVPKTPSGSTSSNRMSLKNNLLMGLGITLHFK